LIDKQDCKRKREKRKKRKKESSKERKIIKRIEKELSLFFLKHNIYSYIYSIYIPHTIYIIYILKQDNIYRSAL